MHFTANLMLFFIFIYVFIKTCIILNSFRKVPVYHITYVTQKGYGIPVYHSTFIGSMHPVAWILERRKTDTYTKYHLIHYETRPNYDKLWEVQRSLEEKYNSNTEKEV